MQVRKKQACSLLLLSFLCQEIVQDLSIDQNMSVYTMFIQGHGYMQLLLKLSLITIGDTEGHDKFSAHYCSYSSIIQQMCRDCNILQSDSDDPLHPCKFVEVEEIKHVVLLLHRFNKLNWTK